MFVRCIVSMSINSRTHSRMYWAANSITLTLYAYKCLSFVKKKYLRIFSPSLSHLVPLPLFLTCNFRLCLRQFGVFCSLCTYSKRSTPNLLYQSEMLCDIVLWIRFLFSLHIFYVAWLRYNIFFLGLLLLFLSITDWPESFYLCQTVHQSIACYHRFFFARAILCPYELWPLLFMQPS